MAIDSSGPGTRALDSRSSPFDLPLALALFTAGGLAMMAASHANPAAFHFIPSMDGCVTVGVAAILLVLAAGLPYRYAVLFLPPILALQYLGARVHGASFLAVLGVEAAVVGAVGALIALGRRGAPAPRERARTPAPAPAPARRRPVHAH